MIFITATGGVLSIILIIALAFLLRQRDRLSLGNRKNAFIVSASAVNYRYEQKNLPKRYQSQAICASPPLAY